MRTLQPRSQNERLLAHFVRGRSITTLKAFRDFGICRLSERVRELRARGHRITSERVKVGQARVARYRLEN